MATQLLNGCAEFCYLITICFRINRMCIHSITYSLLDFKCLGILLALLRNVITYGDSISITYVLVFFNKVK